MANNGKTKTTRIFCNRCERETNHICEVSRSNTSEYDDLGIADTYGFRVWKCAGCDKFTFEEHFSLYGVTPPPGVEVDWVAFYPDRQKGRLPRKHFTKLPTKLDAIYGETLGAFNGGLPILCAISIRALLEGICADKGIIGTNLAKKIEGLTAYLPKNIVDNLHSIRFIGNTAAHELEPPRGMDLSLAIEILEDLLNILYDLDYKTERLARYKDDNSFS